MKPTFCVVWNSHIDPEHQNKITVDSYRKAKAISEDKIESGLTFCAIGIEWAGYVRAPTDATKPVAFISCLSCLNIPPSITLEAIRQVAQYAQNNQA